MLEVLAPGLLSTLQDGGRAGFGHLGIGRAGAADQTALRLANALVGNDENACAIEMTLQGGSFRLHRDAHVAVTGASLADASSDDQSLPMWRSVWVRAGSTLGFAGMAQGCRSYLAISGGIHVDAWLGSRSRDINAALGPAPLSTGDRLPLGATAALSAATADWWLDPAPWFDPQRPLRLRVTHAFHTDALEPASLDALTCTEYKVLADSNRVGVRLAGPKLAFTKAPSIISEGVMPGTIQLPPNGQPIVLGCEHPVTGGYPRIGQLAEVDLPRLAQLRPGDSVCFHWITQEQARWERARQKAALAALVANIRQRLGMT